MIDFIFQVDLSIIYIIHRRDFFSHTDKHGTSTLPLGSKFYYTAAEANSAAKEYCLREAAKGRIEESAVVHGEKDELYRGSAMSNTTGFKGGRERFEVIVRRLEAGGNGAVKGESRGSVLVGGMRGEERRRASWSESIGGGGGGGHGRPGTRDGRMGGVRIDEETVTPMPTLTARSRLSSVGDRRPGTGILRAVEEEEDSSGTEEFGRPEKKRRRSLLGRCWGTLRRK